MKPEDFQFISQMIKQRSGLVLGQEKLYLLESRLMPVARKEGHEGVGGSDRGPAHQPRGSARPRRDGGDDHQRIFLFRDIKPFDFFRHNTLPELLKSRAAEKAFRIWCAASSSGQEPYTLAMILKEEAAKLAGWRYEIVATDVSTEMLDKAKAGLYSQFEVQRGLPVN